MRVSRIAAICLAGSFLAGCGTAETQATPSQAQFGWWNAHSGWWNSLNNGGTYGPVLSAAQKERSFCSDARRMYAMTEYLSTYAGSLGVSKASQRLETVEIWANAAAAKAPSSALKNDFEGYASTLGLAVSQGLAIDLGQSSRAFSGNSIGKVPTRQNLLLDITSSADAVSTMRTFFSQIVTVCPGLRP